MATIPITARDRAAEITARIGRVIPIAPHDTPDDVALTLPHPLEHDASLYQVSILGRGERGPWQIALMVEPENVRAFIAGTAPTKVEPRITEQGIDVIRRVDAALDGQLIAALGNWRHLAGRRLLKRLMAS